MLDGVDAKAVDVGLADPVTVGLDNGVDDLRADGIIVIGIVLQSNDVAELIFRGDVKVSDLAAAMVPIGIARLGGNWLAAFAKAAEVEALGVVILLGAPFILPVIA